MKAAHKQRAKGRQAPKKAGRKAAKLGNAAPPQTIIIQDSDNPKQADTMFGLNSLETTILKYTVGGGVLVVGFLLVSGKFSKYIDERQVENHLLNSSNVGTADYYARELADAFDVVAYYGNTDRGKVKDILTAIPTKKVWNEVQSIYAKVYNKPLLTEMKAELGDYFDIMFGFQDAMNIINAKP
jgi:hypothetical protein